MLRLLVDSRSISIQCASIKRKPTSCVPCNPSITRGYRRGERRSGPFPSPLKNHKNKGCLSNTGLDYLENHKTTKPAFNVGPAVNGASLVGRWWSNICVSWIISPPPHTHHKNVRGWTPSDNLFYPYTSIDNCDLKTNTNINTNNVM